jgi:hypothetical protein
MSPMNRKSDAYLSKTLFIRGLQCHKSLYLHKYHPDLKDEVSEQQEASFQIGRDVGVYAQNLFPNGVEILFDDVTLTDQLSRTTKEIENGTAVIYEAAFSFDNIFVKVDILRKHEGRWEIYEVKNSTSVKDVHHNDVAIQYYVLKGAGLSVSKAFLVHINNQYVRNGDIEVERLFIIQDLTEDVIDHQEFVEDEIKKMREMLKGAIPDIDIGGHCSDPYECDFGGHCWQHIPENSIFVLRGNGPNKLDLYRQGVIRLEDVPKDILPRSQRIQIEGVLEKKNVTDKTAVREFLDTLWYPICFLDFETTFMVPIPLFDGSKPYQKIPFQYSLHCLERDGAELLHYEYLAQAKLDPRREFLEKLLNQLPEDACVLVYNKTFETGILNELIQMFPEHEIKVANIISNIRDLMIPFRNKDIYRWEMEGSYSLKYVLPALVPELKYEEMEISDGGMAANAWLRLWEMEDSAEIGKICTALLEYCKLDTLAMVRVLEELREVEVKPLID